MTKYEFKQSRVSVLDEGEFDEIELQAGQLVFESLATIEVSAHRYLMRTTSLRVSL